MPSDNDIKLPLHGESPQTHLRAPVLPRDIRAITVSGNVILVRWGLRGWTQLSPAENRRLREKLGL